MGSLFNPPVVSKLEGPLGALTRSTSGTAGAAAAGVFRTAIHFRQRRRRGRRRPECSRTSTGQTSLRKSDAIDLTKGDILWNVPHGDTPENIKNHPALKGLNIPNTGRPGTVGTLVTRMLLVAGDAGAGLQANGQRGAMLRAYDRATGKRVGAVFMPAAEGGSPMTYLVNGRQYIVIAISGGAYSGELLAFKLPG